MTTTQARPAPALLPSDTALTTVQARVLAALRLAGRPLGAYALRDRLGGQPRLAPMQVYRALDRLATLGLIHRLESLNAYVACSRDHAHGEGPVAFAICRSCGHVDELEARGALETLHVAAGTRSFEIERPTLELTGLCRTCGGPEARGGAPT